MPDESKRHSEFAQLRKVVAAPTALALIDSLEEQYESMRLVVTRQLTPLDVAVAHIGILRRKSEEYTPSERDNVAIIVEQHVNEARSALFASLSNLAKKPNGDEDAD